MTFFQVKLKYLFSIVYMLKSNKGSDDMRLVKTILILLISYFVISYYGIFSLDKGLVKNSDDNLSALDYASVKNAQSFKNPFDDEEYYLILEIKGKNYIYTSSKESLDVLDFGLSLFGKEIEYKTFTPAIIGGISIIAVLVFVRKKR